MTNQLQYYIATIDIRSEQAVAYPEDYVYSADVWTLMTILLTMTALLMLLGKWYCNSPSKDKTKVSTN